MKRRSYRFHYLTIDGGIAQEAFLESQIEIRNLLEAIKNEMASGYQLNVRVAGIRRGSVDLALVMELVVPVLPLILNAEQIVSIRDVMKALGAVFRLENLLKGKSANKIEIKDNDTVVYGDGNQVTVSNHTYHLYVDSSQVKESAHRAAKSLRIDPRVQGLEVLEGKKKICELGPDSNQGELPIERIDSIKRRERVSEEKVSIVRPLLDPKRRWKWTFVYKGFKINALVSDSDFNRDVEIGKITFRHGDALMVSLKIVSYLDSELKAWINESYEIVKVHSHIFRNDQEEIPFEGA